VRGFGDSQVPVRVSHPWGCVLCPEPESRRARDGDEAERPGRRLEPQLPGRMAAHRPALGPRVLRPAPFLRAGDETGGTADPRGRSGHHDLVSQGGRADGAGVGGPASLRRGVSPGTCGRSVTRACRSGGSPGSPGPRRTGRTTAFRGRRRSWSSFHPVRCRRRTRGGSALPSRGSPVNGRGTSEGSRSVLHECRHAWAFERR
jgi:hypothetical protein